MEVIKNNFRCSFGEVDIVSTNGYTVVFSEVKTRKRRQDEELAHSLNAKKQKHIVDTALFFLNKNPQYADRWYRFDVFIVELEPFVTLSHIPDAF